MKTIQKVKSHDLKTVTECVSALKKEGFTSDFQVTDKGLKAMDGDKVYSPEEIKIVRFYRFEGDSDPADMSILYAIETNDKLKGTLSDAYGTYASRRVSEFFDQVENIQKKTASKPK